MVPWQQHERAGLSSNEIVAHLDLQKSTTSRTRWLPAARRCASSRARPSTHGTLPRTVLQTGHLGKLAQHALGYVVQMQHHPSL